MKNRKQKGKARKSEEVVKLEPILIKGGLHKKKKHSQKKAKKIFKDIIDTLLPKPKIVGVVVEEKKEVQPPGFVSVKLGDTIKEPPLQYSVMGSGGCAPVINNFKTLLEDNVSLAKRYIQAGYKWRVVDMPPYLAFQVMMFKAEGSEVRGATLLFCYRDYIWWGGGIEGLDKKLKEIEQWFVGLRTAGYDSPKPEEVQINEN